MAVTPSASYSLTIRVQIVNRPGMLGRVALAIGEAGGDIGAVDIVAPAVAEGVARAASQTGTARRRRQAEGAPDS